MSDKWTIEYGTRYEECPKCKEQGDFTGVFSVDNHEKYKCPNCKIYWWEMWYQYHKGRSLDGLDDYPNEPDTVTITKESFKELLKALEYKIEDMSWRGESDYLTNLKILRTLLSLWEEDK